MITIEDRDTAVNTASEKLFLLTLEDIKKMNLKNTIIRYYVAESFEMASKKNRSNYLLQTLRFRRSYFHIDDKYGIDVDDIYNVDDILDAKLKEKYCLKSPNLKLYLKKILYR
jgi:hypothetical protein